LVSPLRTHEQKAMFSLGQIAYDEKMFEVAHQWFYSGLQNG